MQFTERNDLGHLVVAVFLLDVVDYLVASVLTEVDIEVRHRHALGIEEALEQEAEPQRVQIGDGQRPCNDRARARTAARADRNSVPQCPLNEIRDDQEVAGEAHLDDDIDLELEPIAIGFRRIRPSGFIHLRGEDMLL